MTDQEQPGKLVPALIGGGIMALLSTVPFISLGNCLCCLWILLGGAIAAFMYHKEIPTGQPFSGGDGAKVGLLAGIFGALFGAVLGYIFMSMGDGDFVSKVLEGLMNSNQDFGPEMDELMAGLSDTGNLSPMYMMIGLFFSIVLNVVFGALGGMIGASMIRKKQTPPADSTPTQQ